MAKDFTLSDTIAGQETLGLTPLQTRYANTNAVYKQIDKSSDEFTLKQLPDFVSTYKAQNNGLSPTKAQVVDWYKKTKNLYVTKGLEFATKQAQAKGVPLISPETYQLNTQPRTQNPVANALSALKTGLVGTNPTAQQQLGGNPTLNFGASLLGNIARGAVVGGLGTLTGGLANPAGGEIIGASLASGADSALQNTQAQRQAMYQGKQPSFQPQSVATQATFDALPIQFGIPQLGNSLVKNTLAEASQETASQFLGNITNPYSDLGEGLPQSAVGGGASGLIMSLAQSALGKYGRNANVLPQQAQDPNAYTQEQQVAILGNAIDQLVNATTTRQEREQTFQDIRTTFGDDVANMVANNLPSQTPFFETNLPLVNPETKIYQGGVKVVPNVPYAPVEVAPTLPQGEAPSTAVNALASVPDALNTISQALQPTQDTTLQPESVTVPQSEPSTSIPPTIGDVSQQQTQEVDPQQQLIQQLQSLPMEQQQSIFNELMARLNPQTPQEVELPTQPPIVNQPPKQTGALQGQQIAPNPEPQAPQASVQAPQVQTPTDATARGFKQPLQETFNLNDDQAQAVSQVYEATNRTMAERNAITPDEQARRFSPKKIKQVPKPKVPLAPVEEQPTRKTAKVYDNDSNSYEVRYKAVEASDLITSNNDDLTANKAYPQELQPRDRQRATSYEQINEIAQKLTPEKLTDSKSITDGSPIVGSDNVVESGNGRTMAIRQAYKTFRKKGEEYKAFLEANAKEYGLDPEAIKSMKQPVLVRERLTETDRVTFAKKANESTIANLSILEQAKNDASKLDLPILRTLKLNEKGEVNGEFSQAFTLGVVPQNEHPTMVNKKGLLSAVGLKRIENALLVKAFPNANNLATLLDSAETESVNLGKAMFALSPTVAEYKAQQEQGIYKDYDISSDLGLAVEKLLQLREEGVKVKEYRQKASLLSDTLTPEANKVLDLLADYANKPAQLINLIRNYYQFAVSQGGAEQVSFLPDASKLELLEDAEVATLLPQLANMSESDILALKEKLSDAQFKQIERSLNCG